MVQSDMQSESGGWAEYQLRYPAGSIRMKHAILLLVMAIGCTPAWIRSDFPINMRTPAADIFGCRMYAYQPIMLDPPGVLYANGYLGFAAQRHHTTGEYARMGKRVSSNKLALLRLTWLSSRLKHRSNLLLRGRVWLGSSERLATRLADQWLSNLYHTQPPQSYAHFSIFATKFLFCLNMILSKLAFGLGRPLALGLTRGLNVAPPLLTTSRASNFAISYWRRSNIIYGTRFKTTESNKEVCLA